MYCKNCGEQMNDIQAICLKCGVKAGDGNRFCSNCGQPVEPGAAVCLSCGVATAPQNTNNNANGNLGGYDKVTMALVCFFLGGLGIHNFMMGENKKGITRILLSLCCGIGGIIALIDFIRILTGSYTVDPNAYI